MRGTTIGILLSLVAMVGCTSSDTSDDDDGPVMVGAAGLSITSVKFYQSVERVLWEGGTQGSAVPLVAGRQGLMRVFHTAPPEQVGQPVTARLSIEGREPIEVPALLSAQSAQHDLNTTINIDVPGDRIDGVFNYRLDILQEQPAGSDDNPAAHLPFEGFEPHGVDTPQNTFRVVLVPFQYNADGSGRLPDMSPESVEIFRQRLTQFYPVSNAEVTVHDPVPWSTPIQPNGAGWQEVGMELFSLRSSEGLGQDVYYYAIFNPRDTLAQFCGAGCLLGVTLLNDQPADVGNPSLRLGLGVGFPQTAYDTCAHELAHAHGRPHAPCGGVDPSSIDMDFPQGDGGIGEWGWDMFSGQLKDPAIHKDMMGYCDPSWISGHNFAQLAARAVNVNLPDWQPAGVRYRLLAVDLNGRAQLGASVPDSRLPGPPNKPVTLHLPGGTKTVMAHHFRYDHLPGGWLFYPEQDGPVTKVTIDQQVVELTAAQDQ